MKKSRWKKWAGHVALIGRIGMQVGIGEKARRKKASRKTKT
jgi:hypothetical protein